MKEGILKYMCELNSVCENSTLERINSSVTLMGREIIELFILNYIIERFLVNLMWFCLDHAKH